ncbi:exo-beta-N-acetylmuramidase NamZ domain-containing protein [Phocaeicola coprocola]|uniref:exo-beta-N-acetylmuramidase NamZ family protein n=1 Tax=Phocaeicola coprocola TaxID=310298 RepID=UPI003AF0B462
MKYITLFICWLAVLQATAQVKNGADRLEELLPLLENKRISLVVNQTSLVQNVHLLDTLYNKGVHITQVFAPEHGFRGDADAGEFIKNGKDYRTQVPIISLYGKNKKPQPAQLQQTDIVIFDIQDVGARFYTYISTMFYVMQACAENNKELIILDRPNPCDYIDGPVLDMKYKSFVGMLPIPVLHGCTIGELAQMINGEGWLGNNLQCPLKVITIEDWKHGQPYSLPVKPSPNLPNDQAIALYPSLCPFEGTSVSVGRGTDFPFQIIGSPTTKNLKFRFMPHSMKGSDKHPLHQDTYCYGLNLSSEKNIPKGFSLQYVIQFYNYFQNLTKHAEKEFFTRPHWFDLLMGTNQVRLDILKNKTEEQIRSAWQKKLNQYKEIRKKYLLYEDYPAM